MFLRLLFLLTMIPIAEIYILLQLSDIIGGSNTFLVIVGTGILGAWLLKKQGASAFENLQKQAAQNQVPADAITQGLFLFIGGVLLLTPGLITDALGLSLVFPLTQIFWKKYFQTKWQQGMQSGRMHVYTNMGGFKGGGFNSSSQQAPPRQSRFEDVIDIQASESETISKD